MGLPFQPYRDGQGLILWWKFLHKFESRHLHNTRWWYNIFCMAYTDHILHAISGMNMHIKDTQYELDLTSHASRSDKPWGISFSGTVSSFVSSGLATECFFDFFDLLGFSLESDTFSSLPSWSFSVFFLLLGFSVCFSSLFFFSICTLPPFFLVSTVLVAFVPLGLPRLPGAVFLVPFALASSSLCASLCSLSGSSFSRFSFSSISPEPKVLAHCRASLWAYGENKKWNLRSINHGLFTNYSAISAFMRSSSFFASAAIAIESLSASLSREAFTVGTGANSSFRCFSWLASSIFYERRKKRWE